MKKILIITQDEINNEQNKSLFDESISFFKDLASNPDLLYTQLGCFKHQNGLLDNIIHTYLDNSNRHANIIFDSPDNINAFNKAFPKKTEEQFYKEVFNTQRGISVSNIRKMAPLKNYNSKINISYYFNKTPESICNNFNYVILHHGGSKLLYYFTVLNQFLFTSADEQLNFKKLILINKNHLFDNLLAQYKVFSKFGIEKNGINENVQVVESLSKCLDLLEQDTIYTPHSFQNQFTID
ncbi:MAG: hypothetical protein J6D03_01290 [Clostridia bacterium]|nr:hypothetical protein [Clostridia bacterium]